MGVGCETWRPCDVALVVDPRDGCVYDIEVLGPLAVCYGDFRWPGSRRPPLPQRQLFRFRPLPGRAKDVKKDRTTFALAIVRLTVRRIRSDAFGYDSISSMAFFTLPVNPTRVDKMSARRD